MTAVATEGAEPSTWVGRRLPRVEDPAIVRGWGNYVADFAARDQACRYAVFVRSTIASGRLISVTAPPEVELITAADLEGVRPINPRLTRPDYVAAATPILAAGVVRFVGEPVAMVIADSPALAEDAAELVDVEIEPLTPVLSVGQALAEGAPLVHPGPYPGDPNTGVDAHLTTAGFEQAMQDAAHRVSLTVSCARQSAMPMEARASYVSYDRGTGRTTLTTTTQSPHVVRTGISDCLGISEDLLRVVAPDVGGAFGAKMSLAREDIVLVHAARRFGGSLAWIETREENFLAAWHSREQRYDVTAGFDEVGRIVALQADLVADVGAYSCYPVTYGVEPLMAFGELTGPYAIEQYSVRSRAVLTNKCPIAPYRGVSRPVQTLAMERLMDTAARELGRDPIELRLANLITEYPFTTPTGMIIDESSHVEALKSAVELADLDSFRQRQREARAEGRLLGIGFSCFAERTGYGVPAFAARGMEITPGFERVHLAMDPSGNVVARIGTSPHGQGLRTSLSQVIADAIGVEPSRVRVVHSDTDNTPYGWGTYASHSMVLSGGAARIAGEALQHRLQRIAADMLECAPEDVEIACGLAQVRGTSAPGVAVDDLARRAHHASQLLPAGEEGGLEETALYNPLGTFSNAVHVAEIELDPATGSVRFDRFLVVEDVGVMVNPNIVDGQVHGGVAQGIANALYEELIYDEAGNLTTTSLMDFLPPTIAEMPHIEIEHRVTVSDFTLTGAKGVGEGGTIGAPAAVLNALTDATAHLGLDFNHLPATPSRIRDAIRTATNAQGGH